MAAKAAGVCSREGGKLCRHLEAAAGNIHSGMPIGVARRKATQFSYSVSVAAKAAGYGADKGRDPRLLKAVAWTEILVNTAPTDAPPGPTRPSRSRHAILLCRGQVPHSPAGGTTPRGLRHTLRMRAGTDQDPKSNAPDRHADPRGGGGGGRGHARLGESSDLSTG